MRKGNEPSGMGWKKDSDEERVLVCERKITGERSGDRDNRVCDRVCVRKREW